MDTNNSEGVDTIGSVQKISTSEHHWLKRKRRNAPRKEITLGKFDQSGRKWDKKKTPRKESIKESPRRRKDKDWERVMQKKSKGKRKKEEFHAPLVERKKISGKTSQEK